MFFLIFVISRILLIGNRISFCLIMTWWPLKCLSYVSFMGNVNKCPWCTC